MLFVMSRKKQQEIEPLPLKTAGAMQIESRAWPSVLKAR